jgi:hypothetical protein
MHSSIFLESYMMAIALLLDFGSLTLECLALDQVWDLVIIVVLLLQILVCFGELAKLGERVGAELGEDAWHELRELLLFCVPIDREEVGGDGGVNFSKSEYRFGSMVDSLTFWGGKVDDVTVRLEHVDLLNGLDRLDVELLERGLELLLIGAAGLGDTLGLSSRCALAAVVDVSLCTAISSLL